ncbi:GrpB family protein [Kitasatospora sp. NPDC092039]|uniref:GrpB family protein n=1 Tax=Kitasatospora sp. NPDC092039 TaxID=3364086 RepID=UPI0038026938
MADLDEPIHVVAYNPVWADLGRDLVCQVSALLQGVPADVEHIGSTAVPGLDAKPVIDVQVGCRRADVAVVVERLRGLGFEHLGQAGVPGREYMRRRSGWPANVHVVESGGQLWEDNVLFRDHLTGHPDAAERYARAKHRAAGQASHLLAYSELKARTVAEIMDDARRGRAST